MRRVPNARGPKKAAADDEVDRAMADITRLKNKARREEQRENWSRAIDLYMKALEQSEASGDFGADLSLYNRIGDIHLRLGDKDEAVSFYETAIDQYAEQDLHTSAIALCNKVLRVLPDRLGVYLKLGRLQLATGLQAEARVNFQRYAAEIAEDDPDAALAGLEEFAAETGDPEMVARFTDDLQRLTSAEEAADRLRSLKERLETQGRDTSELELRLEELGAGAISESDTATEPPTHEGEPAEDRQAADSEAVPEPTPGPAPLDDLAAELESVAGELELASESVDETEDRVSLESEPAIGETFADLEAELEKAADLDAELEAAADLDAEAPPLEPRPIDRDRLAALRESREERAAGTAFTETAAELATSWGDDERDPHAEPESARPDHHRASSDEGKEPNASVEDGADAPVTVVLPSDRLEPTLERAAAAPISPVEGSSSVLAEQREPTLGSTRGRPSVSRPSLDPVETIRASVAATDALHRAPAPDPAEMLIPAVTAWRRARHGSSPCGAEPPESTGPSSFPTWSGSPARPDASEAPTVEGAEPWALTGPPAEGVESQPALGEPLIGLESLPPEVWEGPVNGGPSLEELVAATEQLSTAEPGVPRPEDPPTSTSQAAEPGLAARIDADGEVPAPTNGLSAAVLGPEAVEAVDEAALATPERSEAEVEADGSTEHLDETATGLEDAETSVAPKRSTDAGAGTTPEAREPDPRLPIESPGRHRAEGVEGATPDHLAAHYDLGVERRSAGDVAAAAEAFGLALGSPDHFPDAAEQFVECRSEASAEQARATTGPVVEEAEAATEPVAEQAGAAAEPVVEGSEDATLVEPAREILEAEAEPVPDEAGVGTADSRAASDRDAADGLAEREDEGPAAPSEGKEAADEAAFRQFVRTASPQVLPGALTELERRGEFDKAMLVMDRLVAEKGPNPALYRRRAHFAMQLGRPEQAIEALMKLGTWLEARGDDEEAAEVYRELLEIEPEHGPALAALRQLDSDDGKDETYKSVREDMFEPTGATLRSDATAVRGRRASAPQVADAAGLEAEKPQPYGGLAGGAESALNFEQLLSDFKAELAEGVDEGDTTSRTELGASLKKAGLLDDAIRELQAAVREPDPPPVAFEMLGEAFIEKGQPRVAARLLARSLETLNHSDRDLLGVLFQLGVAYQQVNETGAALECYERIFSVDIDYKDVQERILACSG